MRRLSLRLLNGESSESRPLKRDRGLVLRLSSQTREPPGIRGVPRSPRSRLPSANEETVARERGAVRRYFASVADLALNDLKIED